VGGGAAMPMSVNTEATVVMLEAKERVRYLAWA
jgi:hypothetical protein